MTSFTAHFRFAIPDFTQEPWHAEVEAFVRAVDTALYQAVLIQNVANWANATVYAVGAIVIDAATGLMWTCAVANTSSVAPTTFAQERVAHPTYWNATATIPQQRGTWTTATSYIPGDFVVDTNRYAVCLVSHVSGVFNTDLAAGRWAVLIDLSALGVGLNATAEDTIASASSTNIGSKTATRLHVTGSATINDMGIVANTYKILRFDAGATLKNNANLILLSADILTESNDVGFFSSDSTGKWRLYFYTRASGVPIGQPDASETVKGIAEIATAGELAAGTDDVRIVTAAKIVPYISSAISTAVNTILGGVGPTLDTLSEIAIALGLLAPKANPTFTGTSTFDQISATGNANLAGGTTLPAGDIGMADLAAAASPYERLFYHVRDEQTQGTDGGNLTSGSWNTRILNIEKTDDIGITLSGNQLSLAAGTYYVEAEASAQFKGTANPTTSPTFVSKLRLRNITDGATLLNGIGQTWYHTDQGGGDAESVDAQIFAFLRGRFTLPSTKTIELQNWVVNNIAVVTSTKAGRAINASGEIEVYTDLRLWKTA